MSNNRTAGLRRGVQIAGVGAAATVAMGLFSTGAANADTFVPLPDGQKLGPNVTITHNNEHAIISPSLAANGAGRVAWLSGNAVAEVTATPEGKVGPNNGPKNNPGTNNSSTHGTSQLNTGYIIGCQVSIGENAISANIGATASLTKAGVSGGIGLNLGPGQVAFVQIDSKDIQKAGPTRSSTRTSRSMCRVAVATPRRARTPLSKSSATTTRRPPSTGCRSASADVFNPSKTLLAESNSKTPEGYTK